MFDAENNGYDPQEIYQAFFNNTPQPCFLIKPTGIILEANNAARELFGYTAEEFKNINWRDMVVTTEPCFEQILTQISEKGSIPCEFKGIKKKGDLFPISISSVSCRARNKEDLICTILTDLSDKKHYEQELEKMLAETQALHQVAEDRRQQLLNVLESITDGFFTVDAASVITYWNHEAERLTGLKRTEALGKYIRDIFQDNTSGKFLLEYQRAVASQAAIHFEAYFPPLRVWLDISIYPAQNGLSFFFRDITDRKSTEEKIILHEQTLEQIYNNVGDVIYMYDLENGPDGRKYKFESVNNSFLRATGLQENQIVGKYVDQVIPEPSLQLVLAKYEEAIATRQTVKWEEEILFPSGIKTGLVSITPIYDENKNGIKLVGSVHDITDIRSAEKELQISNERYEYATLATNDAIYDWDIGSGHIHWGIGFEKLFGYPRTGLNTQILFWQGNIYPDDKAAVLKSLTASLENKRQHQWQYEYRLRRADNTYAFVKEQGFIIREQGLPIRMVGALHDITRQKEEEQQLRLLESSITYAPDSIIIAEPVNLPGQKLKIIYTNLAFTRITGYSKEEVLGLSSKILLGPETSFAETARFLETIEKCQPCETEILLYKKSGEPFWSQFSSYPITDPQGNCTHWIIFQRDITTRKKHEAEREVLLAQLTQTNADLKQYTFITSHNLRAPIANLIGLLNLINREAISDSHNQLLLDKFKESTFQLNNIIHDLMEVLVIKNNVDVETERLRLPAIFAEVATSVESLITEAEATIITDFSGGEEVLYSLEYLRSIFLNLLTNAIKYRSPERKLLIRVKTEIQGQNLILSFTDNGIGIDLNRYSNRIFGLYQRFHKSQNSKGFGLFMIYNQIKAMGGNITVASEVNQGTTFVIHFKNPGEE